MSTRLNTVALVDDDINASTALSVLLEDGGLQPLILDDPPQTIVEATKYIQERADAAICDHRLTHLGLVPFTGAQLVANLYSEGFPAVLITQYLGIDLNVELRRYRDRIPVLLARTEADPETLVESIEICREEITGNRPMHRKPWRSLVHIVAKDTEAGEDVLDAIIPSWNPEEAIRFPASLLGHLQRQLPAVSSGDLDVRFFAQVNIGAESARDLFLSDFEIATEPTNDA